MVTVGNNKMLVLWVESCGAFVPGTFFPTGKREVMATFLLLLFRIFRCKCELGIYRFGLILLIVETKPVTELALSKQTKLRLDWQNLGEHTCPDNASPVITPPLFQTFSHNWCRVSLRTFWPPDHWRTIHHHHSSKMEEKSGWSIFCSPENVTRT